ncbi:HD domain-containing protein [Patescibacteria group bacterium]|nr:HD domain-containing protein [Patescibacteria group bacterium]MBU2542987.1 HD domain-containing protein [Patescibacteria group bacterium]
MKDTQLIHPYIERVLRQIILKDLANKGRPRWDKPHTEAVVYWMKYLLKKINHPKLLNPKILLTAAYAHDWGYANLFSQKTPISIDQARSQKDLHMKKSVEMIERLIYQRLSGYFAQAEVLRLAHLVSVHDFINKLQDEDELLLMECDALGMLDVELVPPTLSLLENEHFMRTSIYQKRLPRFTHDQAKKIAQELIKKREKFYQDLKK